MNPWIGTTIGWCLSILYGRSGVTKSKVLGYSFYFVKRIIPSWAIGQTWGRIILIRLPGSYRTLNHEEVHVRQWEEGGFWGLGFMVAYLWESIKHGYWDNKFEVEARERE